MCTSVLSIPAVYHPFIRYADGMKFFNPLTPNDHYSDHTVPLNSKHSILYIYSTNIGTEYFKRGIYSQFFFSSKCSLFHNSNVLGSCIIHILFTGVLKLKKNNSGARRLILPTALHQYSYRVHSVSLMRSKCQRQYFGTSYWQLHCTALPLVRKGVLFLSAPTNHTGLSTMRFFKLHISVEDRSRWMRFLRPWALPSFSIWQVAHGQSVERILRKQIVFDLYKPLSDFWIKIDLLDVTRFIILPFTAQHVANVSTSIFRSLRLAVLLLKSRASLTCFRACFLPGWSKNLSWIYEQLWTTIITSCGALNPF